MRKILLTLILICVPIWGQAEPVMYVHFINVGQADTTLLEFSCGTVLIDAGAQDDAHVNALVDYLRDFFQQRPNLNNTLNTVLITHNHIDHTKALREVAENFTISNYIDNGQLEGAGTGNPNWLRKQVENGSLTINISTINDVEIRSLQDKGGLSNPQIDPITCSDIDPQIRVLSGRIDDNPGWSQEEFDNKNNQSLVVRIDFGESSFLFTGDIEEPAIETLVEYYQGTDMLDVDVYQVGHHGSKNATTTSLLEAMTPEIAVISMGRWDYGRNSNNRFTTWHYGHPRQVSVEMLTLAIDRKRSYPVNVAVAEGPRHFQQFSVKDAIYGTGWFGTVKIRATSDGHFRTTNIQ